MLTSLTNIVYVPIQTEITCGNFITTNIICIADLLYNVTAYCFS